MNPVLLHEMKRKAFHAFSALYALLFLFAGRSVTLWTLGALWAAVAALEASRLRSPALNEKLIHFFGGIHRESEVRRPSGILWTLTGCWLTVFFVPHRDIALTALCYLAVGDGVAGLVGRNWGHIRIGAKSLEGTLSCFLACWLVGAAALTPPFGSVEILLGAFTAALVELLPLPLNDNLWMPLLSGLVLTWARSAAG